METKERTKPLRLLRLPEVEARTGLKKSTLYRLMRLKDGEGRPSFPGPVATGGRTVAWREDQVDAWIESRKPKADCAQLALGTTS